MHSWIFRHRESLGRLYSTAQALQPPPRTRPTGPMETVVRREAGVAILERRARSDSAEGA